MKIEHEFYSDLYIKGAEIEDDQIWIDIQINYAFAEVKLLKNDIIALAKAIGITAEDLK